MVAVAAGCRKALVSTGWAICLLSYANGLRKHSFHFVGTPFLAFKAAFSLEENSPVGGL